MVRYNASFPTLQAATEFVRATLWAYPTCGYDTQLTVVTTQDGTVLVTGSRLASCD
jgi:hypothetical protein